MYVLLKIIQGKSFGDALKTCGAHHEKGGPVHEQISRSSTGLGANCRKSVSDLRIELCASSRRVIWVTYALQKVGVARWAKGGFFWRIKTKHDCSSCDLKGPGAKSITAFRPGKFIYLVEFPLDALGPI
jgi:hypothetical protein